jgi:hypothetical protein
MRRFAVYCQPFGFPDRTFGSSRGHPKGPHGRTSYRYGLHRPAFIEAVKLWGREVAVRGIAKLDGEAIHES